MAVDVLYVAWNRKTYTIESFEALLANTDWGEVAALHVYDDGSTDGTWEFLQEAAARVPDSVRVVIETKFNGPVSAMNKYLDHKSDSVACRRCEGKGSDPVAPALHCKDCRGAGTTPVESFAKIDNDFVVCPGWLGELTRQFTLNPGLDIVGMEPRFGPPAMPPLEERDIDPAEFIGGKGLIRHRVFEQCRPRPRSRGGGPSYYGWSEFQKFHPQLTKAWISPDLPVFGLDQLPFEPWVSLAVAYSEKGWHRAWPAYDALMDGYWKWWTPLHAEAAA